MKTYNDLLTKYPELFYKEEKEEGQSPFSLFGFECDDGWFNIISNAFATIYFRYNQAKKDLSYWQYAVDNLEETVSRRLSWDKEATKESVELDAITQLQNSIKKLEETEATLPKFVQIKEKFGGLRMYFDGGDYEKILAITDFAERMSEVTCEICGNVGKTYRTRWHKTLCKEHAIERYGENVVKEAE
jgi:hypothetical protein